MSDQEMNTFQPGPKYWSRTYEWARWNPAGGNLCQPPRHLQQYAGSRHWHCHWKENQKWVHSTWERDVGTRGCDMQRATRDTAVLYPKAWIPSDPPNPTLFNNEKTHGSANWEKNNVIQELWRCSVLPAKPLEHLLSIRHRSPLIKHEIYYQPSRKFIIWGGGEVSTILAII